MISAKHHWGSIRLACNVRAWSPYVAGKVIRDLVLLDLGDPIKDLLRQEIEDNLHD